MATGYWDYGNAGTGYWDATTSTSSTTGSWASNTWTNTTATTTSTYYHAVRVVREYLVESPESWDKSDVADFVSLVNDETNTGFTVTMVIHGDIDITDPNVEKRSMEDFIPLLKSRANRDDKIIINDFFIAHPINGKQEG